MIVGVPKEIKNHEYRVGLTPASVREITHLGHQVLMQVGAGVGVDMPDADYQAAGATLIASPAEIFARADMIIKVKEPQEAECLLLRPSQILFTYLHLAAAPHLAKLLQQSDCIAIAYETVTDARGGLPLLAPSSEVAGRMSIQAGAHCLEKSQQGRGVLLSGVPGVPAAEVVVLGGGVVGMNAVRMAMGAEAHVTVIDKSLRRLQELDLQFGSRLNTLYATREAIESSVLSADLVIGAVLVPGATAPKLVTREMVKKMRPGAVIVDIAIDQGGCCETSHATTHADPTYIVDGVVHYCVANMPGAIPRTASLSLNNATLPYILAILQKGYQKALLEDVHLLKGLNVYRGKMTYPAVAEALGVVETPAAEALKS